MWTRLLQIWINHISICIVIHLCFGIDSTISSAFNGHFLPHLLDVPDAVDPRSSLHLQQPCPHSPRGLSSRSIASLELQTALSLAQGKERRSSTTGTGAGPEGTILIANVVLSMPKQRWMTIQMLIWFIQICNLKNRLLNRDPVRKWLTNTELRKVASTTNCLRNQMREIEEPILDEFTC